MILFRVSYFDIRILCYLLTLSFLQKNKDLIDNTITFINVWKTISMAKNYYVGLDIGGTKSAVILADGDGKNFNRQQFATEVGNGGWKHTIEKLKSAVANFVQGLTV